MQRFSNRVLILFIFATFPVELKIHYGHDERTKKIDRPDVTNVGCSLALKLIQLQTEGLSSNQSLRLPHMMKVSDGKTFPLYQPICQSNRPDLYTPRQCVEEACFCVNVTSGIPLTGTQYSKVELGDCITVALIIRMKVKRLFNPLNGKTNEEDEDKFFNKILVRLERLFHSIRGHQVICLIRRVQPSHLSSSPSETELSTFNYDQLIEYEILVLSTGHTESLVPFKNLILNQLDGDSFFYNGSTRSISNSIHQIDLPPDWPLLLDYDAILKTSYVGVTHLDGTGHVDTSASMNYQDSINEDKEEVSKNTKADFWTIGMQQDYPVQTRHLISARQTAGELAQKSRINRGDMSAILSQPGVIAGIIGSAITIILLLILLILFCIYRLRKRDEGSYSLDEAKKEPASTFYSRTTSREFYA